MPSPSRLLLWAALASAACSDPDPDMVAVARSFQAPPAWTLVEQADVSEPTCLRSDCRTVVVRWATADRPAGGVLRRLMAQAGWDDIEIDACEPRPNTTGPVPFCHATARERGTEVDLSVAGPVPGEVPWLVTLRVDK